MARNKIQMTAVGVSPTAIPIRADRDAHPLILPPGILLNISFGGTATCTVLVTGDDTSAIGYSTANGIWNPFDGMAGVTASTNGTLQAKVAAITLQVTAITAGTTVTLSVIQ